MSGLAYVYNDSAGAPRYRVVRREPKAFHQEHFTQGGWVVGLNGEARMPYRLPELNAATKRGGTAFVVEGEGDTERLIAELAASFPDVTVTTSAGGAAWEWPRDWAEYFRGLDRVYVIADNDDIGRRAAQQRASVIAISGSVTKVQMCLPGVGEHGDVSEYLDQGHTVGELFDLCEGAPQVQPIVEADDTSGWPALESPAFHGISGEIIDALDPHTEADRAAMLLSLLAMFGNAVGSGPHARVGANKHAARLNVAIVGKTSRARKDSGTSMVAAVMEVADPRWAQNRVLSGFGSGERVIDEVADPVGNEPKKDRRLLIRESELARVHTIANRENSILSMVCREAWDGGRLSVRTRAGTATATDAHISVIGHITADELRRTLTSTEIANGFGNRTLYAVARRSKKLPSGGNLDDEDVARLGRKLGALLQLGRQRARLRRTPQAEEMWDAIYRAVDDSVDGLFGAVTARGEAQMLRLSLIYALLDGRNEIDVEHIRAAVCVWSYCEASARWIFDEHTTGDSVADRIFLALVNAGRAGLDLTQLNDLFAGHTSAKRLKVARDRLVADELVIEVSRSGTGGRSETRLLCAEKAEHAEKVGRTFADRVREHLFPLSPLSPQVPRGDHDAESGVPPVTAVTSESTESGLERELRLAREAEAPSAM